MKLWIDTASINSAGRTIPLKVSGITTELNRKVLSRGVRAVNEIRNAELEVLKGQRSGRVYRKYPYRSTYTASAPGEAPARRTGNLRLHWNGTVESHKTGSGFEVTAVLESQEKYSVYLEYGTRRMAPRPFHDRIIEKARPGIERIYRDIT